MNPVRERPLGEFVSMRLRPTTVEQEERYRLAGVYSFGKGMITRREIRGDETKYDRLYRVLENDLVLSRLKAFEGAIAVVPAGLDGAFVSQEFPTFVVNEQLLSVEYLKLLCQWPGLWRRLAIGSRGLGSRRERVSTERLLATTLPIPGKIEQERVVSVLGVAISDLRAAIERRRTLEEAFLPTMLSAAFTGKI